MFFAHFMISFVFLFFSIAAYAQDGTNRVALVIGNSLWAQRPSNPVRDAMVMTEKLTKLGFKVFPYYNADQNTMQGAIGGFAQTLRRNGGKAEAFIYYAGHGTQQWGENYLYAVTGQPVSLSSITSMLEQEQTRLAIVVLDCCRSPPARSWGGSGQTGFAAVNAPAGSLIAYSTSPGYTADDGPNGGDSPYAKALADWITQPGLKIEDVFKKVREAVLKETNGEQRPWESTSLTGDFYLAGRTSGPTPAVTSKKSRLLSRFGGQAGQINSVAFSPDGRMAASASDNGSVYVWDVWTSSGQALPSLGVYGGRAFSVAFSPDGLSLASSGSDGVVKLWDMENSYPRQPLPPIGGPVYSIAFSRDSQSLATASEDRRVKLWNLARRQFRVLGLHGQSVRSVAFSPDGRKLASASDDGTVKLWRSIDIWARPTTLPGYDGEIGSVAFSRDGQMLASANHDGAVNLWDLSARQAPYPIRLPGHAAPLEDVAFSPLGDVLASASDDGAVKIWDAATGNAIETIRPGAGRIHAVAFSREGRLLLGGSNGALLLYDVSKANEAVGDIQSR
jgi:hypothetical protein